MLANAAGRTAIVEDQDDWLHQIAHLDCERNKVTYSTQISQGIIDPCPVPLAMSDAVTSGDWDVIIVDGPRGSANHCPGRQPEPDTRQAITNDTIWAGQEQRLPRQEARCVCISRLGSFAGA